MWGVSARKLLLPWNLTFSGSDISCSVDLVVRLQWVIATASVGRHSVKLATKPPPRQPASHGPSNRRRRRPHAAPRQSRPLNSSAATGRTKLARRRRRRRRLTPTSVCDYLVFIGVGQTDVCVPTGRRAIIVEPELRPSDRPSHHVTRAHTHINRVDIKAGHCYRRSINLLQ